MPSLMLNLSDWGKDTDLSGISNQTNLFAEIKR